MGEAEPELPISPGPFAPTWESLRTFQVPDWFRDAKLGIWAHWGPQSVPQFGDWYARNMYREGERQYRHHLRVYGHPSQRGWKDIVPLWKAERFDPAGLMRRFVAAGARYFAAQAVHHDNFDNWDSAHHRWNATKVGPLRDIVGAWRDAARQAGLKFGVTEHLGASFSWWNVNKGADQAGPYAGVRYDGHDPAARDLYHDNAGEPGDWLTGNAAWHAHWFLRIKDLLDKYQPDLLYSDSALPFGRTGLSIVAHLYNLSAARHGGVPQAVYTQKGADPDVFRIGVLDIERGQENEIKPYAWQTDTSVGDWFYSVDHAYKPAGQVIEMFVDQISKNGCLLLNFCQRPDGTLDEEQDHLLAAMAAWIGRNGEGVYGTRPWHAAGEGPGAAEAGAFREKQVAWTTADFRFTARGEAVFAFQMKAPQDGVAFIRSLAAAAGRKVAGVGLLGTAGPVVWRQLEDGLLVQGPRFEPGTLVPGYKVTLAG